MAASPTGFSPNLALPGSIGIPALAPVYADGIPVPDIAAQRPKPADSQRFWSSEPRHAGDPHTENLSVSLANPRLINYLSFDVPHFPHDLRAWYWDGSDWAPIQRPAGGQLVIRTSGSVPALVNNPAALAAGLNPYHYGAGHWIHHDELVRPFRTSRILLSGNRHALGRGTFPAGPGGVLAPYPLGIRNLDFGHRIKDREDVPWTPRSHTILTERQLFTTSDDVNGSPLVAALRENRATDMLRGLPWRCAPQARADAVVNLYADSRDASGDPQVIDRFYLDPVTSGVKMNLYYSPDPPPETAFQALDDPILSPLVAFSGSQIPVADISGILFPNAPGWVTLSNQGAGASPGIPWWVALQISPQFGSGSAGNFIIADAGLLQLAYSAGTWQVKLAGGGIIASWTFGFSAGDALTFIAGYDGVSFFAWSPSASLSAVPASQPLQSAATFRFGAVLGAEDEQSPLSGNYRLRAFVLKQDRADLSSGVPQDFLDFAADAATYTAPPAGTAPSTMNAVARFHGSFVLGAANPGGFAGGPGQAYESCQWTPISRDYDLSRGYLEFDPVRASVFKFEFTSLQPAPVDYFQLPSRSSKLFAADATAPSNALTPVQLDAGMDVTQSVASTIAYADAPLPSLPPPAGASLPTEGLYLTSPVDAARLAKSAGSLYNLHPWQPSPIIRRHQKSGAHNYQHVDLPITGRIGYFVALSSIAMFRFDPSAGTDAAQYLETFGDTAALDPASLAAVGAWSWQPGSLTSPPNITGNAQVQSKPLNSAHKVTAVQFATCQSPAVQLLDSPGFDDSTLRTWAAAGDAQPLQIAPVSTQLGNMVQVTRLAGSYGWAFIMSSWASWANLMAQNPLWSSLQISGSSSSYGGMVYNGPQVPTTEAGRLYAAARVFSPVPLSAPLSLQLLDGPTGAVIAEEDQVVNGGTVTEWFVGYTLGNVVPGTMSWTTMQSTYTTWAAILNAGQFSGQLENWAFEDGTDNWTASNAAVTQSGTWSESPSFSLKINAAGAAGIWSASSPPVVVSGGQVYGATAAIYTPAGLGAVELYIAWSDTNDIPISTTVAVVGTTSNGQVSAPTVFGEAPSNSAFARVVVADNETVTGGTLMYADDVIFSQASGPSWNSIDLTVPPAGSSISVQLIQKTATDDMWFVDDISVFEDALIWQFSNDGGASWWPAYDIRNNPSGALLFPSPAQGAGNQLMWRLKGYRPGLNVSSLAIRPWYSVYPHGVLPRAAGIGYGPNRSPLDHYGPIEDDPRWKVGSSPIPEDWFFGIRQQLGLQLPVPPPVLTTGESSIVLGSALSYEPPPPPPPLPAATWTDIYSDIFTDTYGLADGGDLYTDTYSDLYGSDYFGLVGAGHSAHIQISPALVLGTRSVASVSLFSFSSLSASGTVLPPPAPQLGAALGQISGSDSAIASFISAIGKLEVRRVYFGNQIPATLAGSLVAADAGVRKVSMDFQVDATTTPAQLDAFLASCAAGGLQAEVTIWTRPEQVFSTPQEYFGLLAQYVPVIRRNGYAHVWAPSNDAIITGNVLSTWYPGDDLVDVIAPTFFASSHYPGSGSPSLSAVEFFADQHGKPLGLTEFGVDYSRFSEIQGDDFLTYILAFFIDRIQDGEKTGDLIYFSVDDASSEFALDDEAPVSFASLYSQLSASLAGFTAVQDEDGGEIEDEAGNSFE